MKTMTKCPAASLSETMRITPLTVSLLVSSLLVALPVQSKLTGRSGQVQGRAPTASGNIYVLFPNGTTKVTDNAIVGGTQMPNEFKVSPDTSGIVPSDADGDTGLTMVVNTAAGTLNWKYNNVALTTAQRNASFITNFAGKTLNVEASVPVTVTSATGSPTTSAAKTLTRIYAVKVPVLANKIVTHLGSQYSVELGTFAINSGFPTHGFVGASFQIYAEAAVANNTNYNWVSSHPAYATVSTAGIVKFIADFPSPAPTMVITATPKTGGGSAVNFSFKVKKWWKNRGTTQVKWATNICSSFSGYRIPKDKFTPDSKANGTVIHNGFLIEGEFTSCHAGNRSTCSTATRKVGYLAQEWGDLSRYPGSGWIFVEDPYNLGNPRAYHSGMAPYLIGNINATYTYASFHIDNYGGWMGSSIKYGDPQSNYVACVKDL